jgi:hypothetical protein
MAPLPGAGGPVLVARVGNATAPAVADPSPVGAKLLARLWRCADPECSSFGSMRIGRPGGQPPPTLRTGAPTCPRHDDRLADGGPRPRVEVLAVRVDGVVRQRFVVAGDQPVVVGRAPEQAGGITLGQWLTEEARRWISRSHARFELRGSELIVQDASTNGTGIRPGGSTDDDERITLKRQARPLAPTDFVELYPGVHVGRARHWTSGGVLNPASVMAEAPTMTMRTLDR